MPDEKPKDKNFDKPLTKPVTEGDRMVFESDAPNPSPEESPY